MYNYIFKYYEKPSEIQFIDSNLKKAYEELKFGTKDERDLYRFLTRAFKDIQENAFCGVQIPKKQIPKVYLKKYEIKNTWKYNLPNAWRLIYSIKGSNIIILSIIIEWMDHKSYERRFGY